ncbi:MAG: hypothetical protein AB7L09_00555 [Nitrospira sp.]
MTDDMTREEFVDELKTLYARSIRGEVLGWKREEDIDSDDGELGSILVEVFGHLCIDDSDDVPVRGDGMTKTPLYQLDKIDSWKPGLFEKVRLLYWRIAADDQRPILDVIATTQR